MSVIAEKVLDEKPQAEGTWVLREFSCYLSAEVARNTDHVMGGADTIARMTAPPQAAIERWMVMESAPHIFTREVSYAMLVRAWITEEESQRLSAEYAAMFPEDGDDD